MGSTILQRIVETKCAEVESSRRARSIDDVRTAAERTAPARDFYAAVTRPLAGSPRLIAEVKKASPSAGVIRVDFDPIAIARIYAGAGASALSVLTDRTYFSGDLSFIAAIKREVTLPVLRKDFIIDDYQVYESRAAEADAILLIAAILTVPQVESYSAIAAGLGMTTLLEIHDAEELSAVKHLFNSERRILAGINNRDLATQVIDSSTSARLAPMLPPGIAFVAESGLKTHEDVQAMYRAGASAVLIGETFMKAADIGSKVQELMRPGPSHSR